MFGDCIEVINSALAQLGQGPISVSRLAAGITPTAPNGGTASNANDGNLATLVTTTTQIAAINPYIVAQFDLGSLKRLAYVDVYKLALSAGSSYGEFMLEHSIDDVVWTQAGEPFDVTTSTANHRRVNVCAEARYLRVARVGVTNLGTATVTLAGIDVYPFGTNEKDVTVGTLYPAIRDTVLGMYPWRTTMRKAALVAAATAYAPLTEWPNAYEMPRYMLTGPRALFQTASDLMPYKAFELYHGRLYTDIATAFIDYQVRAEEALWPPHLRQLMIYAAAAEFAEPITDQTSKVESMTAKAFGPPGADGKGGYYRTARNIESQNKASESIRDFSLVEVRG